MINELKMKKGGGHAYDGETKWFLKEHLTGMEKSIFFILQREAKRVHLITSPTVLLRS